MCVCVCVCVYIYIYNVLHSSGIETEIRKKRARKLAWERNFILHPCLHS